ncbi:hypothetical protein AZE42_05409 [Rhizopogon vesiculosus]|uniref:Uncharacterized protein n=1 Tax=Rhizopogon vesiculosus TaxID=180088 RepID=A0A1J8Q5B4_9AGAM|nr:hypothetical protein AZE42_05409 [Rhizopogon vesiculosus]
MDTSNSSSSSLYNIPHLAEDGGNWITYKERVFTAIGAHNLRRYVDGRATLPAPLALDPTSNLPVVPGPTGNVAATVADIEAQEDLIDEFYHKDSLVKQQLFSMISDHVLLQVQSLDNSSMIWKEICKIHEGKSDLVKIDIH